MRSETKGSCRITKSPDRQARNYTMDLRGGRGGIRGQGATGTEGGPAKAPSVLMFSLDERLSIFSITILVRRDVVFLTHGESQRS